MYLRTANHATMNGLQLFLTDLIDWLRVRTSAYKLPLVFCMSDYHQSVHSGLWPAFFWQPSKCHWYHSHNYENIVCVQSVGGRPSEILSSNYQCLSSGYTIGHVRLIKKPATLGKMGTSHILVKSIRWTSKTVSVASWTELYFKFKFSWSFTTNAKRWPVQVGIEPRPMNVSCFPWRLSRRAYFSEQWFN